MTVLMDTVFMESDKMYSLINIIKGGDVGVEEGWDSANRRKESRCGSPTVRIFFILSTLPTSSSLPTI